jgi:hypothetical protein
MCTLSVWASFARLFDTHSNGCMGEPSAVASDPSTGGRIGWTLLGILVLLIAWVVVGWIFAVLALLGELGAAMGGLWRQMRSAEPAVPSG